ncbi:MAG: Eco57I restriction-modification methylase domain-containing protein [Solirubrobacteraceae bacterium]
MSTSRGLDTVRPVASDYQLSLLSRGPLFERQVLEQYLRDLRSRGIPQEAQRAQALQEWLTSLETSKGTKETALEQAFNQKVLVEVLGYSLWPDPQASAWPKAPTSVTQMAGEPDVLLGRFVDGEPPQFSAVLELKGPGVALDKPQARARGLTPVEQAFEYGQGVLGVRWVLVSDMRRVRLYSVESPHDAVVLDLAECTTSGQPTAKFRELWGLLSRECLVEGDTESPVSQLLAKSVSRQLQVRDSFYEAYYLIRSDLFGAVQDAAERLDPPPDRDEVLTATQRLLDRMLFIYYCEDTPGRLLPAGTVKSISEAARRIPGSTTSKVYNALKELFAEVDKGSPPSSLEKLDGYNGELFKLDRVIDAIDLPDALHDKVYEVRDGDRVRRIQGVWGLHAFDFWRELNEHLLGHIFEQSLSDILDVKAGHQLTPDRLAERRRHGIYYTSELLSDYLCQGSLDAILAESAPTAGARTQAGLTALLEARRSRVQGIRVIDLACGSGAFLVSSYQALLEELWRVQDGIDALGGGGQEDLLSQSARLDQSRLLRDALHGVDLLPQAAEIAKLALWLRSARKGEKIPDLTNNIVAADSLDVDRVLALMGTNLGSFDMVVGNPPWGAAIDPAVQAKLCSKLGLDDAGDWDSFELFTALGLAFLHDGGRLGFVLPDTFFSPEKAKTRELVLQAGTVERVHDLGPDWFQDVRMGTVLLQVRRGTVPMGNVFRSVLLSGEVRRDAIAGKVPLSQVEAKLGRDVPQDRALQNAGYEIEVFRSVRDDQIMDAMIAASAQLSDVSDRGRGEEMSKAGLLWVCPSCFTASVPATKRKADPRNPNALKYNTKMCPACGLELREDQVSERLLVTEGSPATADGVTRAPYVDGDDLNRRYQKVVPTKLLHLDLKGFRYKDNSFYIQPKILVRKTGVGMLAAYDTAGTRFPQTVFFYRLKPQSAAAGYRHEFLLAALLSRTMAYFLFKRYGQVDPSRGHAHVTHKRLEALPIPKVAFSDVKQRALHDEVVQLAGELLDGSADLGGGEDMRIELALRKLWGLSAEDGAHINLELAQVPTGQVIRDLFPGGLPRQILKIASAGSDELVAALPTA